MVRVIDLESAEDFVAFLRPYAGRWRPDDVRDAGLTIPTGWIYRGKRDASWTLLPKSLRPEAMAPYTRETSDCPTGPSDRDRWAHLHHHVLSELRAVEWFLELMVCAARWGSIQSRRSS